MYYLSYFITPCQTCNPGEAAPRRDLLNRTVFTRRRGERGGGKFAAPEGSRCAPSQRPFLTTRRISRQGLIQGTKICSGKSDLCTVCIGSMQPLSPEASARQQIDAALVLAGWGFKLSFGRSQPPPASGCLSQSILQMASTQTI